MVFPKCTVSHESALVANLSHKYRASRRKRSKVLCLSPHVLAQLYIKVGGQSLRTLTVIHPRFPYLGGYTGQGTSSNFPRLPKWLLGDQLLCCWGDDFKYRRSRAGEVDINFLLFYCLRSCGLQEVQSVRTLDSASLYLAERDFFSASLGDARTSHARVGY